MSCSCPFCKKPKFNIENYRGSCVMHVTTEEQDKIFREYLHSLGRHWSLGQSYINTTYFVKYKENTCYEFNRDKFCSLTHYLNISYRILEFDDFDWSDFMKKEFTKADLKNGDFVKLRDGSIGIALVDIGAITFGHQVCCLDNIRHDLTNSVNRDCDIMAVRRPTTRLSCTIDIFDAKRGTLVYERKEVEEMTLEEVCKALGKEIKIVKK